ncbi:MAG: nitrogenase [Eubacterium sp.]|nr:nitrogenase [Eubacterium sp.]
MIKALQTTEQRIPEPVLLKDIDFNAPFYEGLQYNAPARGVWNIVHTGMLIPETHQVYVCAQGCLRGVILTAAEMNETTRMSWVALREEDMWNGEMEKRVIEGTAHIVDKMEKKPRCILIYLSCMHMFEGCDFMMITDELHEMYPDIDFVECYMIPTMRKTMSPDAMMKISLYEAVEKLEKDESLVGIIGSNLPNAKDSDLVSLIELSSHKVWDITDCRSYDEYLRLGAAGRIVSYLNVTDAAAKQLKERLGCEWSKVPLRFDETKLDESLISFGEALGLTRDTVEKWIAERKAEAYAALDEASGIIGDTEIAIDYTAFPYILEFAELLLKHGFNVKRIYSDNFPADERDAYERIISRETDPEVRKQVSSEENAGYIKLYPTNEPAMRFAASENSSDSRILAIGQKAAYFTGTQHFVDIVEGGGMFGYDAVKKIAGLMTEAYREKKDTKKIISHKGWGCDSCL